MKSISARLTAWYALTATVTVALLFALGYLLLQRHLVHGLDLLNAAEFEQIKARLGPDYKSLSPKIIDERIRETTEYASVLFYIDIHEKESKLFTSNNLGGRMIPDVPGKRVFDVEMSDIGELRVGEFILAPFEVIVATQMKPVRLLMEGYSEVCLGLLAAMLVVSVATGFGLSRLVLRPVRLIRETATHIGSANLAERIPVAEVKDEISDLARLLNQMFDRLELSFDQVRRFTSDASHELKTPLSLIRLHAERMLADEELPPRQKEAVHVQLEELTRLNQIIEELLFLSKADAHALRFELKEQDPVPFLHAFAQDASVLAEHYGLRFKLWQEGTGQVAFEAKWMRQVLLNLLSNALKASPPGGEIALHSRIADGVWHCSMDDQGPGLKPEQRSRMFERFVRFSAPGNEQGTGLGLAICRSIVDLHRGRIFALAGEGGVGLSIVVEIPLARAAAA